MVSVINAWGASGMSGGINSALREIEDGLVGRLGLDIRALFDLQIEAAMRHMAANSMLARGDTAPDFDLQSSGKHRVSLAETLKNGKVILTFYRGSWCNFCNMALGHWQSRSAAIQERGATLLAIAPETPSHAAKFRTSAGITYPLLSDPDNRTADAYGLSFDLPPEARRKLEALGTDVGSFNGNCDWSVPITATFLVDTSGHILIADCNPDYRKRLEPDDIISAL